MVDRECLPDEYLMNIFGLAKSDLLTLGLGMYFGSGKYIWYSGCCSNHFSASPFVEPVALRSVHMIQFLGPIITQIQRS